MKGALFEIREGKLDDWRAWCAKLSTELRNDALETLAEENCDQEIFVIFEVNEKWYTLGLGEGECTPSNKDKDINQEHDRIKKECLVPVTRIELGYHLKRSS